MPLRKLSPRLAGLGDAIEAVTEATGVKAVVEKVAKATGRDCGCKKRRDTLNKLVPFRKDTDGVQPDEA